MSRLTGNKEKPCMQWSRFYILVAEELLGNMFDTMLNKKNKI